MRLSDLLPGQKGIIVKVRGRGYFRKRIMEMGFVYGQEVETIVKAPLQDPTQYKVMDYEVSLRESEAELIEVVTEGEINIYSQERHHHFDKVYDGYRRSFYHSLVTNSDKLLKIASEQRHIINVLLVGNPNSGKTSLFNVAAGKHERVGNYSGVTVNAKEGRIKYKDYIFNLVDLPGTYSLSTCSPEEVCVRKQIFESPPDVIINVVAASNLKRNLYLTTQLIDIDASMVIALNMYDELKKSGDIFDHEHLAEMIGCPIVPTVARLGRGIKELFDKVIEIYEGKSSIARHIHINYGTEIETEIQHIKDVICKEDILGRDISRRYLSIQLLEYDKIAEMTIQHSPNINEILAERDIRAQYIENDFRENTETVFANARYGFIRGALKETYQKGKNDRLRLTHLIDRIVMHKFWSYPIFFMLMFIMFECTFSFGRYPMKWIEWIINRMDEYVEIYMMDGALKELLVNGIIGGVGNVILFLPNIIILYLFISLMEDTGYMARAAFIMDKLMHKIGLHGKSFIPLVMGFGCNVPAIMNTRVIEGYSTRLITMLINPLISCSARLPIYILLIGAFSRNYGGLILFLLYVTGILLVVLMSLLFKKFLIKDENLPFVMELPPYRLPTWNAIRRHVWSRISQYLRKMGGIILIAAIVIWFLEYYPQNEKRNQYYERKITKLVLQAGSEEQISYIRMQQNEEQKRNSFIGCIGCFIEPLVRPLGFDWKIATCLISGIPAKEIIISTLGILYTNAKNGNSSLKQCLQMELDTNGNPVFSPSKTLSLLFFVLLYFPCIATIASIKNESGKWEWALFAVGYTTLLAWIISFVIYRVSSLF